MSVDIQSNLNKILEELPGHVKLVAVSKTKPVEDILTAYNAALRFKPAGPAGGASGDEAGHRMFGENKAQELTSKADELPEDIKWHMIGHMQRNKVKYLVPFVDFIHSVDSVRLLREIDKRAAKIERPINCLLQVHIADEETKFGFSHDEVRQLLDQDIREEYPYVKLKGLMGMATFTDDSEQIAREFTGIRKLFEEIKKGNGAFTELSIGMSNDYKIAIDHGSTMVRLGSVIFGERNY